MRCISYRAGLAEFAAVDKLLLNRMNIVGSTIVIINTGTSLRGKQIVAAAAAAAGKSPARTSSSAPPPQCRTDALNLYYGRRIMDNFEVRPHTVR